MSEDHRKSTTNGCDPKNSGGDEDWQRREGGEDGAEAETEGHRSAAIGPRRGDSKRQLGPSSTSAAELPAEDGRQWWRRWQREGPVATEGAAGHHRGA